MKKLLILASLSLAFLACQGKEGKGGDQGVAGPAGAEGPAGKDAAKEYFISFKVGSVEIQIDRPINVVSEGKTLGLTKEDCVRLSADQVKTLIISLPEAPAVAGSSPGAPKLSAVTVCDNTNKVGGTGADKDNPKTDDDCPLYPSTLLYKAVQSSGSSVIVIQKVGDFIFGDGALSSVQQAKCKTL